MAGSPVNDQTKYKEALTWANKVINSGVHSLNLAYEANPVNIRGGIGDSLMYNGAATRPGYRNNPYSQLFLYECRGQYYVQEKYVGNRFQF
jgi:hypothetical protein